MERNCDFAVITSTGERPDAQLMCAGFEDKHGIQVIAKMEGSSRNLVRLCVDMVEKLGAEICKKESLMAQATFVDLIGTALAKGCGREAVLLASVMNAAEVGETAEGFAKKFGGMLDLEELESLVEKMREEEEED